ncbi:MAG: hypothetical protein L6E13_10005 [Firmicutes bacterium]|nr:hypothetical protein [Bacillota bacterium]
MHCRVHPEREAHALCVICGGPACADCLVTLHGQEYCRPCLERLVAEASDTPGGKEGPRAASDAGDAQANGSMNGPTLAGKSDRLAILLALFPGLGHVYLGLKVRGVQMLVGFALAMIAVNLLGLDHVFDPWLGLVAVFFSVFETREAIGRLRQGQPVQDTPLVKLQNLPDPERLIAYGLITVGTLALVRVLLSPFWDQWLRHLGLSHFHLEQGLLAMLLIAAGVWMLRGGQRQQSS